MLESRLFNELNMPVIRSLFITEKIAIKPPRYFEVTAKMYIEVHKKLFKIARINNLVFE